MTAGAQLRHTKTIRGTVLMTGEDVPVGEASVLARLLVLRVGRGACRVGHLSAVQREPRSCPACCTPSSRSSPPRRAAR